MEGNKQNLTLRSYNGLQYFDHVKKTTTKWMHLLAYSIGVWKNSV